MHSVKVKYLGVLVIVTVLLFTPNHLCCWGFFGHKSIKRLAVFTLQTELIGFYKNHLEYLSEYVVEPDMRKDVLKKEAPRHYIDIDHFGENPFEVVPRSWDTAVEKFTEGTRQAYGIVSWHIELYVFTSCLDI